MMNRQLEEWKTFDPEYTLELYLGAIGTIKIQEKIIETQEKMIAAHNKMEKKIAGILDNLSKGLSNG
jgi:hypothetical protein